MKRSNVSISFACPVESLPPGSLRSASTSLQPLAARRGDHQHGTATASWFPDGAAKFEQGASRFRCLVAERKNRLDVLAKSMGIEPLSLQWRHGWVVVWVKSKLHQKKYVISIS